MVPIDQFAACVQPPVATNRTAVLNSLYAFYGLRTPQIRELRMRRLSAAALLVMFMIASTPLASAAPQAHGWSGWYAGVNVGGIWGGNPVSTSATNSEFCAACSRSLEYANASIQGATGDIPVTTDGLIGGGQLGFNWLVAKDWIAGFEADVQGVAGAGKSASASSSVDVSGFAGHTVDTVSSVSKRLDFLGTVRGRLGYLVEPRLLVFGTGGFAFGHAKSSLAVSQHLTGSGIGALELDIGTNASVSRMLGGWTLGGGFEWMIGSNWSAKAEYLYYDLGKATATGQISDHLVTGPLAGTTYFANDVRATVRFNGSIVRAGLNYRFDAR